MNWRSVAVFFNLTAAPQCKEPRRAPPRGSARWLMIHSSSLRAHSGVKIKSCNQERRSRGRHRLTLAWLLQRNREISTTACLNLLMACRTVCTAIWSISGREVQHFICADAILYSMALMSLDPHLIKSTPVSARRCHHYIKERGRPIWWKRHAEPFYLGHRPPRCLIHTVHKISGAFKRLWC